MKRLFTILLMVSLCCLCCWFPVFAEEQPAVVEMPGLADLDAASDAMNFYTSDEPVTVELLYNHADEAAYIMALSTSDYLIMDRETKVAIEWGAGNPYASFPDTRKYYSAFFNYYVKESANTFVHLGTGAEMNSIPGMVLNIDEDVCLSFDEPTVSTRSQIVEAGSTTRVSGYKQNIKRTAFRKNDDGSCSAIATAIALNYLDKTVDDAIVPDHNEPELVVSINYDASDYPNAIRFVEYIRDTCAMGTDTTMWDVTNAMKRYAEFRNYDIALSTSIDRFDVMDDIDNDLPCMITTLVDTVEPEEFNGHTMVIYGYRKYTDSDIIGWLVHPGYYTSTYMEEIGGIVYAKDFWINPEIFSCILYHFTSPNW